jgi:hypothetical protein
VIEKMRGMVEPKDLSHQPLLGDASQHPASSIFFFPVQKKVAGLKGMFSWSSEELAAIKTG